jgi:hypothetical protein
VRFTYVLFIAAISAMTCNSCSSGGNKYLDEGEIHYSVEYAGAVGAFPREFLPNSLVVSFKDDKILYEMITPIGNSGILNLANPEKNIYDAYFSLLTIKYYYPARPDEIYPGFEAMRGMEITKTSRTSVICGFDCKNAQISFPADRNKKYDIWYTNEIRVKDPNVCTPFHEIDGVLLNFFFIIGHSEMHFNAETAYKKKIPNQIFLRRERFVRVSREEIIRFINKILTL